MLDTMIDPVALNNKLKKDGEALDGELQYGETLYARLVKNKETIRAASPALHTDRDVVLAAVKNAMFPLADAAKTLPLLILCILFYTLHNCQCNKELDDSPEREASSTTSKQPNPTKQPQHQPPKTAKTRTPEETDDNASTSAGDDDAASIAETSETDEATKENAAIIIKAALRKYIVRKATRLAEAAKQAEQERQEAAEKAKQEEE